VVKVIYSPETNAELTKLTTRVNYRLNKWVNRNVFIKEIKEEGNKKIPYYTVNLEAIYYGDVELSVVGKKIDIGEAIVLEFKDGQYFVDDIIKIIDAIKQQGKQNVFIIRSTVYPGFANYAQEKLGIHSIVSNPEFLTEKTWKKDSEHPDRIVIGCDYPAYLKDVEGIYKARFKGVDIFTTDNKTAELSKLASNGFFSTKVIFANQIYDYAKLCGANYEMIKNIMYKSKFIGENHLEVFHQGGRGASGKCLKKDLEALADYTNSPLLRVVDKLNKKYISRTGKQ
ncbi:hypothetical protein LCGC14_2509790, partial [marine sediment metagenome]